MELKKGNRADLNASKFKIGLGWDPSTRDNEDFDLDVSAFILGQNGKVLFDGSLTGEKYIVYYNSDDRILPDNLVRGAFKLEPYDSVKNPNKEDDYRVKTRPVSPNFEVIGSIDDKTGNVSDGEDDEDMIIDLSKLHPDAKEIIIVVSIYEAKDRNNQNFGQVRNSYIRVVDYNTNQEILKYELDEDFSSEDAVAFGRIYKRNETWRFEALGNGTKGGLEFYIKKYSSFLQ
jgi:tellurium resistance protein TerD